MFDPTADTREPRRSLSENVFLNDELVLPAGPAGYLRNVLEPYNEDSGKFVVHVLNSGSGWASKGGEDSEWVPASYKFRKRFVRGAEVQRMLEDGVLERKDFDRARGMSYEWRVSSRILLELASLAMVAGGEGFVDVVSGRKDNSRDKSLRYDSNRKLYPSLVLKAFGALKVGYYNPESVRAHLAELEQDYYRAADLSRDFGTGSYHLYDRDRTPLPGGGAVPSKILHRWYTDLRCWSALQKQKVGERGGVAEYQLAYRVQDTGRISQVGGGLQACSRKMKAAAYEGVGRALGREVVNYDLKSSQAYLLRTLFREAGVDDSWLSRYLEGDRAGYAARVGVSEERWKEAFYAVVMGAGVSSTFDFSVKGAVRNALVPKPSGGVLSWAAGVEFEQDRGATRAVGNELAKRFRNEVRPLLASLRGLRDFLEDDWIPRCKKPYRKGEYVKNEVGMLLDLGDYFGENKRLRKGRLIAFLLQGREAAFIHRLTAVLPGYGVDPISNEHDGLVTVGEVPDEAVGRASDELDYEVPRLVRKKFVR